MIFISLYRERRRLRLQFKIIFGPKQLAARLKMYQPIISLNSSHVILSRRSRRGRRREILLNGTVSCRKSVWLVTSNSSQGKIVNSGFSFQECFQKKGGCSTKLAKNQVLSLFKNEKFRKVIKNVVKSFEGQQNVKWSSNLTIKQQSSINWGKRTFGASWVCQCPVTFVYRLYSVKSKYFFFQFRKLLWFSKCKF